MNSVHMYVADELAHKVKVLTKALSQAEKIVSKLEEENQKLKDVLMGLTSNDKNPNLSPEAICV